MSWYSANCLQIMPAVPLFVCFSLTPFFFFFISISLCSHFITDFFFSLLLKPHICCCYYPSFWPAISRSDPFVRGGGWSGGDHCIFNPDLDNGALTVIFLLLGYLALRGRPCHSHSVTPPPTLPSLLVTNYSRADQCPAMLQEKHNMSRAENSLCSPFLRHTALSLFVRERLSRISYELAVARSPEQVVNFYGL